MNVELSLQSEELDQVLSTMTPIEQEDFLDEYEEVLGEIDRQNARQNHLDFIKYCWKKQDDPFMIGFHTKKICARIDQAFEDFRNGKSTFLRIAIHPRAGKSDIASRFLSPHFISEFPDKEVIQTSYKKDLATTFARFGRQLFGTAKFQELYPHVSISPMVSAAGEWMIQYDGRLTEGRVYASGLQSGLTGSGCHLGIVDDYCSGREAAESPTQRENMWSAFTDDFMTRLAPVAIVIVLATQWHEDDIHGRIENRNNPEHVDYDENFPVFETLKFPARETDYKGEGKYGQEFLFEERYGKPWYEARYSTLGPYSASALMDCNPIPRHGSIFIMDYVQVENSLEDFPKDLKWYRVWDYAHSAKKRAGDNPDYTGGTLLAFRKEGYNAELRENIYGLYIRDYVQFRERATARDEYIIDIAKRDGPGVKILVENSLDSMDGADYLISKIGANRNVKAVDTGSGDKVTRATPLETIFANGRVHIVRAGWNREWLDGVRRFDGSGKTHDEMIDNMSCGYIEICGQSGYKKLNGVW